MPPTPDRRTRNAERLALARAQLDRLERLADVTGATVEVSVTEAGGVSAYLGGRPQRPKPPCRASRRVR